MSVLAQTTWLSRILRCLPAPVLKSLDAWSHRIALRRAQQRREAGARRARSLAQERGGA